MSVSRPAHVRKTEVINEITNKIKSCKGMVIAEYKKISVAQISDLRKLCLEENVFVKVYKDSLFTRAINELKLSGLDPYLVQQNIFLFSDEDPIKPAKLVAKFSKKNQDLKLKAGIYEGNVMDTAAITEVAMLPSKEELYSMFASSLLYPLRQFMLTVKEIAKTKTD
ncbi:50S ribosomal protein L10 [Spiroplasma litorale]|uniref:Large ribosomal subunit protein uL10 n=1 Tax=Spiroplasma litorale TaxID=216942 RepID=A0A0K1W069_9MOLU|nr:50S ribosomal protein L10 [Spiroplasma litorale]AKX33705.1 50S ribosomal protein L10 [Spiroplasma litorale]